MRFRPDRAVGQRLPSYERSLPRRWTGTAIFEEIDQPSKLAWRQEAILRAQRVPSPLPSREQALSELRHVFQMIAEEYREHGQSLPEDSTEIVNA